MTWQHGVWYGKAGLGWVRHNGAWSGQDGVARRSRAWWAGLGVARQGSVRLASMRCGEAGRGWQGKPWQGEARFAQVGRGSAWFGEAWQGKAS